MSEQSLSIPEFVEVPSRLDDPWAELGIGIVAPFDLALDREYWRYVPDRVSVHITRTPFVGTPLNVGFAEAVGEEEVVRRATRDLSLVGPAATAYACTSGSFVRGLAGEERLRGYMEEAGAKKAVTTSGALIEALRAVGSRRVAVATPYDREVTAKLVVFLQEAGFETVSVAFLGLTGDVHRVGYDTVKELASAADRSEADAVFLSCTNLKTFDVLPELEQRLEKPVLSANQVTMWAALRAANVSSDHLGQSLFDAR